MSIFGACMLFVFLLVIYQFITEIFAVLFRFTGLPAEKARFQVVSLLTGCGFTTKESEIIISTPRRRKLARGIILFGYAFTVTIVSALVNIILSLKQSELINVLWGLPGPLILLGILIVLRKEKHISRCLNHTIERIANRIMFSKSRNCILLLDYIGSSAIAQVDILELPQELHGVPLRASGLRSEYGILVMLLERKGADAQPVDAETIFQDGDRLVVCGPYAHICQAFHAEEGEPESE